MKFEYASTTNVDPRQCNFNVFFNQKLVKHILVETSGRYQASITVEAREGSNRIHFVDALTDGDSRGGYIDNVGLYSLSQPAACA